MLNKKKLKILRIIHSLDPRYGGPQNAILDHSISLQNSGIKVDILTSNNGKKIRSSKLKNIKVFYKGKGFLGDYGLNIELFIWLLKNKDNYDYFIVHGLWSFYTLVARILLKKKYFVFTHGQLDPFFGLDFFKKLKKKIYWHLIEKQNLLSAKSLLLTTSIEKELLNNTYVNTKKIVKNVVRYGILETKINKEKAINLFYKKFQFLRKKKFLLYLGRFHDKKGCDIIINSIKKLAKKNVHINILFAGPNNKQKSKLQTLSSNYGLEKNIFWSNIISDELKWGAITASSGMVLSSHGENFGVALVESLRCSRPVFTTFKVNIYKDILESGAGLISNDNSNDFVKILNKFDKLNSYNRKRLSINAYNCFKKNFDLSKGNDPLIKLLKK
jgi:glycosyltransferase involved in cell wall biosynthesis